MYIRTLLSWIMTSVVLICLAACSDNSPAVKYQVGDKVAFFATDGIGDDHFYIGELIEITNGSANVKTSEQYKNGEITSHVGYSQTLAENLLSESDASLMAKKIQQLNESTLRITSTLFNMSYFNEELSQLKAITNSTLLSLKDISVKNKKTKSAEKIIEKTISIAENKEQYRDEKEAFKKISQLAEIGIQKSVNPGDYAGTFFIELNNQNIDLAIKIARNHKKNGLDENKVKRLLFINNPTATQTDNYIKNLVIAMYGKANSWDYRDKIKNLDSSLRKSVFRYCYNVQDLFSSIYLPEIHSKEPTKDPENYALQLRQKLFEVKSEVSDSVIECFKSEKLGQDWTYWW